MNKLIKGAKFSIRASQAQRLREKYHMGAKQPDWRKAGEGCEKNDPHGTKLEGLLKEAGK
jgi:hypothetical protein